MRAELEDSFREFAAAELPRLRRFAYAVCGDWHRTDDLVQGALERMYTAWPRAHTAGDRAPTCAPC
jgi:DNA-directed RNA polymerase specialized sigma24 family protein